MRSGRAFLNKRPAADRSNVFEMRKLSDVFAATVAPEGVAAAMTAPRSELDEPQWSIASFEGIEAGGLTYQQATRLIAELDASGIAGLTIITDTAALGF